MLFQLRDLVFTILEETIRKCFLANHIFGRCYIGLYSKCLNKTIWERFFLEGSHVLIYERFFSLIFCFSGVSKRKGQKNAIVTYHRQPDAVRFQ